MNDFPRVSEGILGEQDTAKTNTELFLSIVGQYFPEAIKDGEVDFAALKEEMGEFAEVGSEHYDITWAGQQAAKKAAQADPFGRLPPRRTICRVCSARRHFQGGGCFQYRSDQQDG